MTNKLILTTDKVIELQTTGHLRNDARRVLEAARKEFVNIHGTHNIDVKQILVKIDEALS